MEQVFISYAWATRRDAAMRIAPALAPHARVWIDSAGIEPGDDIPSRIDRILEPTGVVVILADAAYFTRPYCLSELASALDRKVIVVLGSGDRVDTMFMLPPEWRQTLWPTLDDLPGIVALTKSRLSSASVTDTATDSWPRHIDADPGDAQVADLPPSLGKRFIGRDRDLWRIHFELGRRLRTNRRGIVAVTGTPGMGKSRVAIEYAQRYAPIEFTGGVFWIDGAMPADHVDERLESVLSTLDPNAQNLKAYKTARDPSVAIERELERALRALAKPVLFVVDNVPEDPSALRPLSRIGAGAAHVLATSRRNLALAEPGVVTVDLEGLERRSSAELLAHGLPASERGVPSDWSEIAEWVGDLPIALDLLNRALVAHAVPRARLVAAANETDALDELETQYASIRDLVPPSALRGVAKTFEIAVSVLPPEQIQAAQRLAWLAPAVIPDRLVERFGDLLSPSARAGLASRSFVTSTYSAVPSYGRMHRLLAAYLRSTCRDPETVLASLIAAMTQPLALIGAGPVGEHVRLVALHYREVFGHGLGLHRKRGRLSNPLQLLKVGLDAAESLEAIGAKQAAHGTGAACILLEDQIKGVPLDMAFEVARLVGLVLSRERGRDRMERVLLRKDSADDPIAFVRALHWLSEYQLDDGCLGIATKHAEDARGLIDIVLELFKGEAAIPSELAMLQIQQQKLVTRIHRHAGKLLRAELSQAEFVARLWPSDYDTLQGLIILEPVTEIEATRENWSLVLQRTQRMAQLLLREFPRYADSHARVDVRILRAAAGLADVETARSAFHRIRAGYCGAAVDALTYFSAAGEYLRFRGKYRSAQAIWKRALQDAKTPLMTLALNHQLAEDLLRCGEQKRCLEVITRAGDQAAGMDLEHPARVALRTLRESAGRRADDPLYGHHGVAKAGFARAQRLLAALGRRSVSVRLLQAIEPFVFDRAMRSALIQHGILIGTPASDQYEIKVRARADDQARADVKAAVDGTGDRGPEEPRRSFWRGVRGWFGGTP